MKNKYIKYVKNIIFPCLIFSLITGAFTALTVMLFKYAAENVIGFSKTVYGFFVSYPYLIPVAFAVLFGVAVVAKYFYKIFPDSKGGGIPTSIAILRGLITFSWLKNLVGVFIASFFTFLIGLPLGNEGPCVQIGTAIGRGVTNTFGRKNKAWDRYIMTGGASAGFAVATGAPVSGIFFAIEEAHQRLSPMIIMVSASSVMFGVFTSELLSPLFGISTSLFGILSPSVISAGQMWIPVVIGLFVGLLSAAFLKLYKLVNLLWKTKLKKLSSVWKFFIIFALTFTFGCFAFEYIGTGHEIVTNLLDGKKIVWFVLILVIILRAIIGLTANTTGATGGLFLPVMTLGALFSSLLADCLIELSFVGEEMRVAIILLGISACISGMIKTPITAIVFAIEALCCFNNILSVIIAVTLSYFITEIFDTKSINESVIRNRVDELNEGKKFVVIDTFVTVMRGSFAVGKTIRDIFWPNNLFVLSIKHTDENALVDEHGEHSIRAGDLLHVRFSTYDEQNTISELTALIGEQEIASVLADSV